MSDNSGNSTDKRNWRDKLGIGKALPGELPRLSDDFKPLPATAAARPITTPRQAVQHVPIGVAPMAPRQSARPVADSAMTKRADSLEAKLKGQREDAERMAVQRVQAARARLKMPQPAPLPEDKPKFSFADYVEDAEPAPAKPQAVKPAPAASVRPAAAPRPAGAAPPPYVPGQAQQFQPQIQPPRPPLGANPDAAPPLGYQQGQGAAPAQPHGTTTSGPQNPRSRPVDPTTGYTLPPGFTTGTRPGFATQTQAASARAPLSGDRQRAVTAPRGPQFSVPPRSSGNAGDADDVFEAPIKPGPRRITATEYQQTYRDELGYNNNDLPRSRGLGMILGLLLLGVTVAMGVIYGYSHFVRNNRIATTSNNVPVVTAPADPTKVTPDTNATNTQGGKKQIYDRIEGDHEVPGSPMTTNEEAPVPQGGNDAAQPQNNAVPPPPSGGDDGATPLPLPPPPGGAAGPQGALPPDGKNDMASLTPAAEPVSAANSSAGGDGFSPSPQPTPSPPQAAPVPAKRADAPAAEKPAVREKPAPAKIKTEPVKKTVHDKVVHDDLGAKPVVLVPPANSAGSTRAATSAPKVNSGGLYGDSPVGVPVTQPATGAYVAQLASFNTRAEAQAEYTRLVAKHGAIVSRLSPIIEAGTVAGSTRYRLNLGSMNSGSEASRVCFSLISAGERDCKIGRQ